MHRQRYLAAVLAPLIQLGEDERDMVIVRIEAEGRLDDARRLLALALDLDEGYGDARINLALVHSAGERWDDARRELELARRDPAAQVNNIKVIHFGRTDSLEKVPLKLKAWDVRWIEIE